MLFVALQWMSTTPARLKALVGAGWVVVAILAAVIVASTDEHRDAIHSIAADHAPSVGSAHRIKVELEALDADLVNEMLLPQDQGAYWRSDFQANRVELGIHLINATRSIYNENEVAPVQRIQEALGRYLMAAQAALDAHYRGLDAEAISDYRESHRILETELVPSADALHVFSDKELEAEYEDQIHHSRSVRLYIIAIGIVMLALLLIAQSYIARRFRRRVSPGLVLAAGLTVVLIAYTVHAFTANDHALAGVKIDAYDSSSALLEVEAKVYRANAAKSRWLFDKDERETYARQFDEAMNAVVPVGNLSSIVTRIDNRNAAAARRRDAGDDARTANERARDDLPLAGGGLLVEPLDNVTFHDDVPENDEPTQSLETVRWLETYHGAAYRTRTIEGSGDHAAALALGLGRQEPQANWAFAKLDEALVRWIAINEDWMAHYTDAAVASVRRVPLITILLALAIAASIALAVRPRIKEYA